MNEQYAEKSTVEGRTSCRFCKSQVRETFVDLGMSPLCESLVTSSALNAGEVFYPLHVMVCTNCFLVQLDEHVKPEEIFVEYAYFSSYSDAWLAHARRYTEMICKRLRLGPSDLIVELASNDGYLLQYFVERKLSVLGIEPAANVAKVAQEKGIYTLVEFFGREVAAKLKDEGKTAALIIANNVLAQVPDLNSFVEGMKALLAPNGTITVEFPHLIKLMENNQFDTIYHEHFSYFSLIAALNIFSKHGLTIYDVEQLWTHGGSLRIYARHTEYSKLAVTDAVEKLEEAEVRAGLKTVETYSVFTAQVHKVKRELLSFLIEAKDQGKSIAGYGAPGKGNTLLNYCGIRTDFIDYTVDRNPYKHGKYLPGTRIPVFSPAKIEETRPDYVLILPWNLQDEIMKQLAYIRGWGGKFVVPIPSVTVFD